MPAHVTLVRKPGPIRPLLSRPSRGWPRGQVIPSLLLGAALALTGAAAQAEGIDWSLVGGVGQDRVSKLGVIAAWEWAEPLWQGDAWQLKLRHEVEVAAWRAPRGKDLVEAGYSPVFRLQRPVGDGNANQLYVEAAIGARLLSGRDLAPFRRFSTAFQFSDVLGAGFIWGPQGRSSLGLRVQHLSNARIKRPNPGITFLELRYSHRF